ncbi:MAG: archease [Planctomycetes bacterium]|nr:archease [Planctomycetota bacterium]
MNYKSGKSTKTIVFLSVDLYTVSCILHTYNMRYQLTDHTADIGIRLSNKTLKGIFEDGAFALFDLLCDIKKVQPDFERTISVEAINNEELLNEFLSRLLREFTIENNLLAKVKIQDIQVGNAERSEFIPLKAGHDAQRVILSAIIAGQPYDPKRHVIKTEIKAVTFHNLAIKKTTAGYTAEVVFDV